jgi:hypothetical protein
MLALYSMYTPFITRALSVNPDQSEHPCHLDLHSLIYSVCLLVKHLPNKSKSEQFMPSDRHLNCSATYNKPYLRRTGLKRLMSNKVDIFSKLAKVYLKFGWYVSVFQQNGESGVRRNHLYIDQSKQLPPT